MKASEIVGNQETIKRLEKDLEDVRNKISKAYDEDDIEHLENKEYMINETLAYEQDYCGMCKWYDSGDWSVGISAFCDHEAFVDENGDTTNELSAKMNEQMRNSSECPYFEKR